MKMLKTLSAIAAALALAGCIRDNRDDCLLPLRLHFTYLYNVEDTDLFSDEVETLCLYLYDTETGTLAASRSMTAAELDDDNSTVWLVPPGRFSLVTWGGVKSRYDIDPGMSLDAMALSINADPQTGSVAQDREHLWHNLTTDLLVNGDLTPGYDIDLHKLSNDVTVTIAATEGTSLPYHPSSSITAANGTCDAFGKIPDGTPATLYAPQVEALSRADMLPGSVHSYTTMALADGDCSHLNVDLGDTTVFDGSLTDLIGENPGIDFDLLDDFQVYFLITPGDDRIDVAVSINGWQVTEYDVTLR